MAEHTEIGAEVCEDMEISREAEPEVKINFKKIDDLYLENEDGDSIRFGDIYKNKKTIIILIRHFLCFMSKEYVDDLGLVPEKYLEEADVNLVVIGCGPHKFIKPFREATGYKGKIYTDESKDIYEALGCKNEIKPGKLKESKHVKSSALMGWLKAFIRGLKYAEFQGDVNQQGASIIVGPGPVLHHAHIDQASTDHCPINDLLTIAGSQTVNFKKDSRVITL